MEIKQAVSEAEKEALDQLLWNVLWRPLGLPRDIRQIFKLDKPQIDLIAVSNNAVIGGLVANWLSEDEIEIRHLAVDSGYQRQSAGRFLIGRLINLAQKDVPVCIQTYARDTSVDFFGRLGFAPRGCRLEHKDFARQGIHFQQMYLEVPPRNLRQS
jgi:N-acetylglutamate synthase-like GNAT family acetyltransferase